GQPCALPTAAGELGILFHVARTGREAHGHALLDPAPLLVAATLLASVDDHIDGSIGESYGTQLVGHFVAILEHARAVLLGAVDRNDDDVSWREPRRQHEPVVVGMGHDQSADHPRRCAPARRPRELMHAVLIEEANLARFRKILT